MSCCLHRRISLQGTWQAGYAARVICEVCGADILLSQEQVDQYEAMTKKDKSEAARFLSSLLPE